MAQKHSRRKLAAINLAVIGIYKVIYMAVIGIYKVIYDLTNAPLTSNVIS